MTFSVWNEIKAENLVEREKGTSCSCLKLSISNKIHIIARVFIVHKNVLLYFSSRGQLYQMKNFSEIDLPSSFTWLLVLFLRANIGLFSNTINHIHISNTYFLWIRFDSRIPKALQLRPAHCLQSKLLSAQHHFAVSLEGVIFAQIRQPKWGARNKINCNACCLELDWTLH